MKGTAVLTREKSSILILENIDRKTYEEIKNQCGCEHCNCSVDEKRVVDFGYVLPIGYKEDEIDWDYGY